MSSSYPELGHVSHEFFSIRKWHCFGCYHFSDLGAGWYQDMSTATCRYRLDILLAGISQVRQSSVESPQFANEFNSASSLLGIFAGPSFCFVASDHLCVLYNEPNIWDMTGYPDIAILPDLKFAHQQSDDHVARRTCKLWGSHRFQGKQQHVFSCLFYVTLYAYGVSNQRV